jgi:acyl-CoA thioesterase FadM
VTVLVMIDRQIRKPVQIPEAMRRTMAGYLAPDGA